LTQDWRHPDNAYTRQSLQCAETAIQAPKDIVSSFFKNRKANFLPACLIIIIISKRIVPEQIECDCLEFLEINFENRLDSFVEIFIALSFENKSVPMFNEICVPPIHNALQEFKKILPQAFSVHGLYVLFLVHAGKSYLHLNSQL
jgi:hypothetical protein